MQVTKKGKWIAVALAIILIGGFLGGGVFLYDNRNIEKGVYQLKNDDMPMPKLTLKDNGQFELFSSASNSYYGVGTYSKDGKQLTLTTEDGLYKYVFTISNQALQFEESKSTSEVSFDMEDGVSLVLKGSDENN